MLSTAVFGGIGGGGGGGGSTIATAVGSAVGAAVGSADATGALVVLGAALVTAGGGALIGSVAGPQPATWRPVKRHPERISDVRATGRRIYLNCPRRCAPFAARRTTKARGAPYEEGAPPLAALAIVAR